MKTTNLIFSCTLLIVTCFSCNQRNGDYKNNIRTKAHLSSHLSKTGSQDGCLYVFANDTIEQRINIRFVKRSIDFIYQIKNLRGGRIERVTGKATILNNKYGNLDLGEDEEGTAYTVDVYEFKNEDYWLRINIDYSKKDKVTVDDYNDIPILSSIGILRKK